MSMLDESLVRRTMRARLRTVSTLPEDSRISWENIRFDPPAFDAAEPIDDVLWVREWQEVLSETKSSTGYIESVGRTLWGVYTPTGRGTRGADDLSQAIAEAFEAGRSLNSDDETVCLILERTSRDPYRPGGPGLESWIFKTVTVRWRAFTPVTP